MNATIDETRTNHLRAAVGHIVIAFGAMVGRVANRIAVWSDDIVFDGCCRAYPEGFTIGHRAYASDGIAWYEQPSTTAEESEAAWDADTRYANELTTYEEYVIERDAERASCVATR